MITVYYFPPIVRPLSFYVVIPIIYLVPFSFTPRCYKIIIGVDRSLGYWGSPAAHTGGQNICPLSVIRFFYLVTSIHL